jgi:predicted nucleic acid-binding protein
VKARLIIDTGVMVAALDRRDAHHDWAAGLMAELIPPAVTCEACLAEAAHLLRRVPGATDRLLQFVVRGHIVPAFRLTAEARPVAALLAQYADVPMDLADACLVRLSELHPAARVLTTDSDFRVYRRNGRGAIPVIMPD